VAKTYKKTLSKKRKRIIYLYFKMKIKEKEGTIHIRG
jgi:hypothetical protein